MSEKENPWSEDETDTGTTTEANEPIEVEDLKRNFSCKIYTKPHKNS